MTKNTTQIIVLSLLAGLAFYSGCSKYDHGSVEGIVVSAVDGQPIAAATIAIGGEHGQTDLTGFFNVFGINTGEKDLMIKADGYYLPGDVVKVDVFDGTLNVGTVALVPVGDMPPGQPGAL